MNTVHLPVTVSCFEHSTSASYSQLFRHTVHLPVSQLFRTQYICQLQSAVEHSASASYSQLFRTQYICQLQSAVSNTVHLPVTASCFEHSTLNCDKCNTCILQEVPLACKNFDFLKTHKTGCSLDASHYSNMVTYHNSSSVVAETSSPVLAKLQQTYRLYGGTRKYHNYPTDRSLSRVLDNGTKGRTRYYQIWLHVAQCNRHRS